MVASPTPIVPISSDSISRISTLLSHCERTAAVIQPAVPPPTIVTLPTGFPALDKLQLHDGNRSRVAYAGTPAADKFRDLRMLVDAAIILTR